MIERKKRFGKSGTYQEILYTCSDDSPRLYIENKGKNASAEKWLHLSKPVLCTAKVQSGLTAVRALGLRGVHAKNGSQLEVLKCQLLTLCSAP